MRQSWKKGIFCLTTKETLTPRGAYLIFEVFNGGLIREGGLTERGLTRAFTVSDYVKVSVIFNLKRLLRKSIK